MPKILKTKDFVKESVAYISEKIRNSVDSAGSCVLCLAGGKTPLPVYEELAKENIDWSKVYIIQGDERNLPSTHPESNYKLAYDFLISRIPILPDHVFRIETELGLEKSAAKHEEKLKELQKSLGRDYLINVLLLGIGNDGHTASLFPDSPALKETGRWVVPNSAPKPYTERITLTYPILNSAKNIIFMADYESKKDALEKIWAGQDLPAAHIKPVNGQLIWIIEE